MILLFDFYVKELFISCTHQKKMVNQKIGIQKDNNKTRIGFLTHLSIPSAPEVFSYNQYGLLNRLLISHDEGCWVESNAKKNTMIFIEKLRTRQLCRILK